MSLQEKIRLRLPSYLIFSFLSLLGLLSLWLPKMANQGIEDAQALTYSPTTTIFRVPEDSKHRLLTVGDTFYLVFTSSTTGAPTSTCGPAGSCNLYFTSSSNGLTWSAPVTIATGLGNDDGNNQATTFGNLTYNTRQGYLATLYKRNSDSQIYIATSTNGATWRSAVAIQSSGAGSNSPSARANLAFATSTDLAVIALRTASTTILATTTNTMVATGWTSSTIQNINSTYTGNNYNAEVHGVSIEGSPGNMKIHAIIGTATTSVGYCISGYQSTNLGGTWTSSTILGCSPLLSAQMAGAELRLNTAVANGLGRLDLLFYQITALDGGTFAVTNTVNVATMNTAGTAWTSSTLATVQPYAISMAYPFMNASAIASFNSTSSLAFYLGNASTTVLAINTSTSYTSELISAETGSYKGELSLALNTSTRQLGMIYNYGTFMRFVTSSLRDPSWNNLPTTTAITPVFATSGTGYVTVTSSVSDFEGDTTTLYVDYSLDGGTTWASSTLASASATSGSVSTAVGRITGITTASTNTLTFVWDSKANGVTATTTAMIRIGGSDLYGTGIYRSSAAFTVDNVPLSAPDFTTVAPGTSTIDLVWGSVVGASEYAVSSSLGTVVTTGTVAGYTLLVPNTRYSFQLRDTDAYGNTSTFSTVTSTYTYPDVPGTPSSTASGTTGMVVTWFGNYNATGTVYELYNVTASTLVATTTDTSYIVNGLTAATSYQFKVRAQYAGDSASTTAYSDNSTAVSTDSASSGGGGGGGGGGDTSGGSSGSTSGTAASAPAAPVLPPAPATPAPAPTQDTFSVGSTKSVIIGNESHQVTVQSATDAQVTVEIRSNPVTVTISKGQSVSISTNNDEAKEVMVEYQGLVNGKPQLKFTSLIAISQNNAAFTINSGAAETSNQAVRLDFNVTNAAQVAIASESDFAGAVFQTYQKTINWTLPAGPGLKTLYARFRTAEGGVVTLQDTITLTSSYVPVVEQPPVTAPSQPADPSTYQFAKNFYVGAKGVDVTELQKRLKALGYFGEEPSGVYGNATMAAVKKYQTANGIQQTGGVGPATRAALNRGASVAPTPAASTTEPTVGYKFTQNLYIGARGSAVTELQNRLKAMGYFTDTATGFYGNATMAAVKKYQAANGIQQTGGVGPATRASLNK